jgi:hypothetical protein
MPTRPPSRRSVPALVLALVALAGIVTANASAARLGDLPTGVDVPAAPGPALGHADGPEPVGYSAPVESGATLRLEHRAPRPADPNGTGWISRPQTDTPAAKARVATSAETAASAVGISGRNQVWIPSLGIRRSVAFFSCSSNAYPGDRVYRWGCAGRNNVYLFGHAHSVFRPLHDAYVRGRLQKGMEVHYADGNGKVSTYRVIWWRVTTPDKGAFAFAAQSRPSMTLQTCVGAKSQYRLVVRLERAG